MDFLLRQVAYLTEQHASQVRDELRKAAAAAKGSAAPSPIPGAEPGAGHQRTASALSARKDSPFQPSGTGTPVEPSFRPNVSRNSSGNSPAYSHNLGGGSTPRPTKEAPRPGETLAQRQRLSSLPMSSSPNPPSPGPADSSSSSGDSDDSSPAQSRIIRRPPRFQSQDEPRDYGDDDDDVEPAFQALDHGSSDMNATVRGDEKTTSKGANRGKGRLHKSQTSDSSTGSSAAMVPRQHKSGGRPVSGPISPRAAQLAGRSPGGKNKDASREGSDGTPSMGSSFSDLDGTFFLPLDFGPTGQIMFTRSAQTHRSLSQPWLKHSRPGYRMGE